MSRLEELIQELCPNGVEYKVLGELCNICTGKLNANAKDEEGIYPFFTCDANPYKINEYAFDTSAILISGNGSQVGHLNQYEGKFNAYQRTYVLDNFKLVIKPFLFHFMDAYLKPYIMVNCKKGSVPYITLPMLQSFNVPVPPLEVQREIVRILDSFTLLTTELRAELTARKKQYEYYRDALLAFRAETPQVRLGDICTLITKGTTPKSYTTSGVAFVKTEAFEDSRIIPERLSYVDNETHTTFLKRSNLEEDDILITIAGATIGKCAMVPKDILPANTNQALAIIRLADGNSPKYVMYVLQSDIMKRYMAKSIKGSAQPNLNLQQLNDFIFPLPSFDVQMRLVHLLDNFEKICNDITTGLPAEIEARQKQYEFYRDKLLSFKQL